MNQLKKNQRTLVTVHGYAGDRQQILDLLPVYEHHQCPIVVISPSDSQIHGIGPHICRSGGKRAYIGQDSLDRQYEHFKIMLEYDFDFYLANDSDSFVITPELPQYLYDHQDTIFSNEVSDFRKPGESWQGQPPWPKDYHAGYPLIAMQPPYFFSRKTLERFVATCKNIKADPITPFLDWAFVQYSYAAKVKHRPFYNGASCETVTPLGIAVMKECITKRGATFIHSVKSASVLKELKDAYDSRNSKT